jgi:hypothetical protein
MTNERLNQIINLAEDLKNDPQGEKSLKEAIENVERLLKEGETAKRVLETLKQIQKVINLIPPQGQERNN